MKTVTRQRELDASETDIRDAITDVETFMQSAGFDEIERDGNTLTLGKAHGLLKVKLVVRLLDEDDSVLAYEQEEGIFAEMTSRYTVEAQQEGVDVHASTRFEIDETLDDSMLDEATVATQRGKELEAQLDYLETLSQE